MSFEYLIFFGFNILFFWILWKILENFLFWQVNRESVQSFVTRKTIFLILHLKILIFSHANVKNSYFKNLNFLKSTYIAKIGGGGDKVPFYEMSLC